MGSFVAHKHAKKVYRIDHHLAMTIAGTVGDAQALVEMLRANSSLYRLDLARPIPVNSAARLVSNILFGARYYPLGVQALIGGVDDSGGHIYALDPLGSMMEEKYVSTGSGSPVAYGVRESNRFSHEERLGKRRQFRRCPNHEGRIQRTLRGREEAHPPRLTPSFKPSTDITVVERID